MIRFNATLTRLVDSRDIVELQLKQPECEITIRKKEALQPHRAAASAPVTMLRAPTPPLLLPQAVFPSLQPSSPPMSSSAPAPSPSKVSPAPPSKAGASSHLAFKCPMAGTFYRSPAPGAPPFVKVFTLISMACFSPLVYYIYLGRIYMSLIRAPEISPSSIQFPLFFSAGRRQGSKGPSRMHHRGHEVDE